MEALFHFLFEIVKILILATGYSTVVVIIFKIIANRRKESKLNELFKKWYLLCALWFCSASLISIGLFFFMFSYWGDHGLGDFAQIPIGYHKDVKEIDGSATFIDINEGNQIRINNFTFDHTNLYAEVDNQENGKYVVWNLNNNQCMYYKDNEDYLKMVRSNNYPATNKFETFDEAYSKYWNSWRFFLLP